MAATFNVYNTLSSTYWYPVDFSSITGDYNFTKTPVAFSNGMNFYLHNFLAETEDVTFNRKTGLILTNPKNTSAFASSNVNPATQNTLTQIQTPLAKNGYIVQSILSNSNLPNSNKILSISNQSTTFTSNDVLTFNFLPNNALNVINSYGKYLTINGTGEGNLYFSDLISPPSVKQQFSYWLGVSSICLFDFTSNYQNPVQINYTTNNLILSPYAFGLSTPLDSITFYFTSYTSYQPNANNAVMDSFITKYQASPIIVQNDLIVDNSNNSLSRFAQNYLAAFPVENPYINGSYASYLMQFHGLKNYQTPEYTYSTANPYLTSTNSINRIYNKIYSGTNQNKGYNNVYLGFQANTKQFTFPVEQETYFYFPSTNTRYPVSAVGLIQDGATAGEVPYISDKIYVYRQDYQEFTPGIPQPPSITKQDRTWLCAWLSGSSQGNKTWMDRYYNAAYYTLDQALTAKALVYNDRINPTLPYTYDVPSSLVLEPGVLYKYQRIGQKTSKNFVNYLNYDPSNPLGSNVLNVNDWSNKNSAIDTSNFKNNGILVLNTDPQNLQQDYINLDGTNSVVFPARTSLLQNEQLTVSLWLNVNDWSNIFGEQIFGNYYSSGFGLINDSFITAPMFTILNNSTLSAFHFNYNLLNVSNVSLPSIPLGNEYLIVQRLPDLSYWVFDIQNITGIQYSPLNKPIQYLPSYSGYLTNIDQVEFDGNQNIYLYDNTIKGFVKTDSQGNFISFVDLSSTPGVNRIELDLNNVVQIIYGNASVIDNQNNIWEVVGGNLYKNRVIFANVGVTQQILCDSQNRIWLLHLQDTISVLDQSTNTFTFSTRFGQFSTLPVDPCLNQEIFRTMAFLKVPATNSCNSISSYEDQLVVIDTRDNQIYVIDSNFNLKSKISMSALVSPGESLTFTTQGDFTSYQFLRKYGGFLTKNLSWRLKIANFLGNNSQLISLSYDVSQIPQGWHHFALTFDSVNGVASYYIDSILVNQQTFNPGQYVVYYDYRSSLNLGASNVLNTTLNNIIGIEDNYKFIGKVADLKIYSKPLTQGQVEQLYFSSDFSQHKKDLVWNMSVGNRNYIEEIEHWFKFQMPGSKSKYFNINIHNLNINNTEIQAIIEDAIRKNISKIAPAETVLYNINWM